MKRRLSAILAADLVGYSRLMGADEAGTLSRLQAIRAELINPTIEEHAGRIFKLTGDGILAEFPSVVDAVACAQKIQCGCASATLRSNRTSGSNSASVFTSATLLSRLTIFTVTV